MGGNAKRGGKGDVQLGFKSLVASPNGGCRVLKGNWRNECHKRSQKNSLLTQEKGSSVFQSRSERSYTIKGI